MKLIKWIILLPIKILKLFFKIIGWLLNQIFGFLFGWIPDLDERMSGEMFEDYVKEVLKRNGYKKVKLTSRTGDYGTDILASYKGETYAFQCKLYKKPVGVAAVQQAYAGREYYGCDWAVVVTNSTYTRQAITLAKSNDVLLWDGEDLKRLKRKANAHALFHRYKDEHVENVHPYHDVIQLLLSEGFASTELLSHQLKYSEHKAHYILEDLEFHDLVSGEDDLGIRDLLFDNEEDALKSLSD